jgi:hypothetical protein
MLYNRLKEFLLNKVYLNSDDFSCLFIIKSITSFCIISIYIDDLNIIDHAKDIDEAHNYLKKKFEMKDLGKIKFCLALQSEHLQTSILVHQSAYVKKVLEKFNMDKTYFQMTPIIVLWKKIKIHLGQNKREKRFWELNIHTLVTLLHSCT